MFDEKNVYIRQAEIKGSFKQRASKEEPVTIKVKRKSDDLIFE